MQASASNEIVFRYNEKQTQLVKGGCQTPGDGLCANVIFYGGARGGGKSVGIRSFACQLALENPGIQIMIFRLTLKDLKRNHIKDSMGFLSDHMLGKAIKRGLCRYNDSKSIIQFKNGANIELCYLESAKDVENYIGANIHVLLFDEVNLLNPEYVQRVIGSLRLGEWKPSEKWRWRFEITDENGNRNLSALLIMTGNPGGQGHSWLAKNFVHGKEPGKRYKLPPALGGGVFRYIPATMLDNPLLLYNDPGYLDRLFISGNEDLVRAWVFGDFNIVTGAAFSDVCTRKVVIPSVEVPESWPVVRTFDMGTGKPFATLWTAEADGKAPIEIRGELVVLAKGSKVVVCELFGGEPTNPAKGVGWDIPHICKAIKDMESNMVEAGLCLAHQIYDGAGDVEFYKRGREYSEADEFRAHGVIWHQPNKSPGSRSAGFRLVRQLFRSANESKYDEKGLYIFDRCKNLFDNLQQLPLDLDKIDDVDTDANDHDYDALRMALQHKIVRIV